MGQQIVDIGQLEADSQTVDSPLDRELETDRARSKFRDPARGASEQNCSDADNATPIENPASAPSPDDALDPTSLRMITVYQPWASLLVHGIKRIETRSRSWAYTGLLFIHAGLFLDESTRIAAYSFSSAFRLAGYDVGKDRWACELPRGAIIGAVRMTGCMATEDLIETRKVDAQERELGDYRVERFGWLMSHAIAFKNPIPCRGGQGPRFVPSEIARRVMDELSASTNLVHQTALTEK